jgi:hypothetical protein
MPRRLATLAAAIAVVAVACGGGATGTPTAPAAASPAPPSAGVETPATSSATGDFPQSAYPVYSGDHNM